MKRILAVLLSLTALLFAVPVYAEGGAGYPYRQGGVEEPDFSYALPSKTTVKPTTAPSGTTTESTTVRPTDSDLGKTLRLAGADRFETSIAISRKGWTAAEAVVVANGFSFADALAGTPFAAAVDAPILLTGGKSAEPSLLGEISRLNARKAYLLGGTAVISADVEGALKARGMTVVRLSGSDRYGTAVEIAKALAKATDGSFTEIFFASAANFPDALAISSAAAIKGDPILYAPQSGKQNAATAEYALSTGCRKATILGGTAAISEDGAADLKAMGFSTVRVYGSDRYSTAVAIYNQYDDVFDRNAITVATGGNFPDALSGAVYAAKLKAPVVLVGGSVSTGLKKYLASYPVRSTYIFGGSSAVSDRTAEELA